MTVIGLEYAAGTRSLPHSRFCSAAVALRDFAFLMHGPSGNSSCRWFETEFLGFAAMSGPRRLGLLRWSPFFATFSYAGVSAFLALYARELDFLRAAQSVPSAVLRYFPDDMSYLHRNICDVCSRNMLFTHACWLLKYRSAALGAYHGSIMMIISGGLIGIGHGSGHAGFPTQIGQLPEAAEPHKIGVANSIVQRDGCRNGDWRLYHGE